MRTLKLSRTLKMWLILGGGVAVALLVILLLTLGRGCGGESVADGSLAGGGDGSAAEEPADASAEALYHALLNAALSSFGQGIAESYETDFECKDIEATADAKEDWDFDPSGTEVTLKVPQTDIVGSFGGTWDPTVTKLAVEFDDLLSVPAPAADASEYGGTYPLVVGICDDWRRSSDGSFPTGDVVVTGMLLNGAIPLSDSSNLYHFTTAFTANGVSGGNHMGSFDPYLSADLWFDLHRVPGDQWYLAAYAWKGGNMPEQITSDARVIIDGSFLTFFIPAVELGPPLPSFNWMTSYGRQHEANGAVPAFGGDISGGAGSDAPKVGLGGEFSFEYGPAGPLSF